MAIVDLLNMNYTKVTDFSPDIAGFRGRANEVGKEVMAIKTMKGELALRDDIPDPGFLRTWYQLDENVVPPVYRLNKIRYTYDIHVVYFMNSACSLYHKTAVASGIPIFSIDLRSVGCLRNYRLS